MPTRVAHRWVKGTNGWAKRQLGDVDDEQWFPDECNPNAQDAIDLREPHLPIRPAFGSGLTAPRSDQAMVEHELSGLAEWWQTGAEYACEPIHVACTQLPRLWELAITRAAATFPARTGVGSDNFSPRALVRLSAEARESLAQLIMAAETLGFWGCQPHFVLIALLAKATGGLRPIGLLPLEV